MSLKITRRGGLILVALACLALGFVGGVYTGITRGVPFTGKENSDWAIGVYAGDSPLDLAPPRNVRNPVLTARDVTDVPARFVADPFLARANDTWYMFFEVFNERTDQGDIGLATSPDGLRWTYRQIVLDEPFHLSYPYVFQWQGDDYMIPESGEADAIRLYRATAFPTEWAYVTTLLAGRFYLDTAVIRFADRWWLFTTPTADNDTLLLFYADDLLGPWVEHPQSPIIAGDARIARLAGRVLVHDGRAFRFTQDDSSAYGRQVQAFEITELTPTRYAERPVAENPILAPAESGWNSRAMHHVDPHLTEPGRWIASVDARGVRRVFGLQY